MPILDQYERTYSAPPDPIGTEPDDHDPNDDRHDPDGLEDEFDWITGWTDINALSKDDA